MLPIIARSAEVVLRVVPGGLREASLALGASQWQTVWRVVLPTARPGLATALILGIARGVGETAPVLIISGASTFFNDNPFKNPMNSLPLLHLHRGAQRRADATSTRGFGAASVLLVIVLVLFVVARLLARRTKRAQPMTGSPTGQPSLRQPSRGAAMRRVIAVAAAASASTAVARRRASATRPSHALIQGSGSSWAANAVNQWIADVTVATACRSSSPRPVRPRAAQDFANKTTDFGVTDIGYQGVDPAHRRRTTRSARPRRTPTCRSSPAAPRSRTRSGSAASWSQPAAVGQTLAKIFTNQITNWDDPEITADNNGTQLPSLPIIPVVHSEGSGSTAQFTRYLATEYPSIWGPFYARARSGSPSTSRRKGAQIAAERL